MTATTKIMSIEKVQNNPESKDRLYELMAQYEVNNDSLITDLDTKILRELKINNLFNREGIRSLLNDLKTIFLEKKSKKGA